MVESSGPGKAVVYRPCSMTNHCTRECVVAPPQGLGVAVGAILRSWALRLGCAVGQDNWEEPDVAGKKRPKPLIQTEKKPATPPKRPKKTSRGK